MFFFVNPLFVKLINTADRNCINSAGANIHRLCVQHDDLFVCLLSLSPSVSMSWFWRHSRIHSLHVAAKYLVRLLVFLVVPRSCDYDVRDYGSNYYRITWITEQTCAIDNDFADWWRLQERWRCIGRTCVSKTNLTMFSPQSRPEKKNWNVVRPAHTPNHR